MTDTSSITSGDAASSLEKTARAAGLQNFDAPSLESVEKRRLQLWVLTIIVLFVIVLVLALASSELGVELPAFINSRFVQISLPILVVLFAGYALEKELQLKRLTRMLVDERVLTSSLVSRIKEISTLLEAGKAINLNLDLEEVLSTILRCARELLKGREVTVFMIQGDEELREMLRAQPRIIRFGEGIEGEVAESGESKLLNQQSELPDEIDPANEFLTSLEHSSVMCSPLVHRDKLLGVIRIEARMGTVYTEHDLRAFSIFAEQAAAAIANSQLYEEERFNASKRAYQALHDPLTGLPNRTLFIERVENAIQTHKGDGRKIALFFIDLDDFKKINDSFGHDAGDEVLQEFADRLRGALRPDDTVARFGGDEFVVLAGNIGSPKNANVAAQRLYSSLEDNVMVASKELRMGVSIGIAVQDEEADNASILMRNADIALHQAKVHGKRRIMLYESTMHEDAYSRVLVESDIDRALQNNELEVYFQPICDLTGRRTIKSVEALVRWNHPERGLLGAHAFVPFAQQIGRLQDIDRWVLRETCAIAEKFHQQSIDIRFHVNLIPSNLHSPDFVDEVRHILDSNHFRPDNLVLEITESDVLLVTDETLERLTTLKSMGPLLAMDDFGTGYSSLSYLSKLPLDIMKIDRVFVSGLAADSGKVELVESITKLCARNKMELIAEGIEHEKQVQILLELGCEIGQGFLLGRPMAVEALLESFDIE